MPKSGTPRPSSHLPRGYIDPSAPLPLRALMAVYRFLASVKLAVISLLSLGGSLAFATWFEKKYGSAAVQQCIYESVWFSILLAMLAINIFCAALIRFPWKRRQLGFVVTHAGLLTLIFGSWWGFQYSDEGQAGAPEGGVVDKLMRSKHPLIRVAEVDRETGKHRVEYELPFQGGPFDWPEGKYEVVSKPKDPFKVAVKGYFASSSPPRMIHIPAKDGMPMVELRPRMKPPGSMAMTDVFPDPETRWFGIPSGTMGYRTSRKAGPAKFAFLYVDRPELVDDFLNPPKDPGSLGVARLRYVDNAGKPRVHEVRIDDARPDTPFTLPDSDLTVTFIDTMRRETDNPNFIRALGDSLLSVVKFNVRKGSGPEVSHTGYAGQPMIPAVLPSREGPGGESPLLSIGYFLPPSLGGGGMAGNFGVVEVLGDNHGKLYYRVFGRDETPPPPELAGKPRPGVLKKPPAPLKAGEPLVAFGGNPNMPMTLDFTVGEYLLSGEEKLVYEHQAMPEGQQSDGLAAALVEITLDGEEPKEVWLQRPINLDPASYVAVPIKGKEYDLAFDCDRKPLGFSMVLKDFEVGYDPGTSKPASYMSEVVLTDEEKKIKDKPVTITMNHPLTHRDYTFYQSSFTQAKDPRTGRPTGDFTSVFQVGHDAGRPLKYAGSLLIVLGAFLQFYMKAGLFTDGGKSDREKSAERARRLLDKKAGRVAAPPTKSRKLKKMKVDDEAIL